MKDINKNVEFSFLPLLESQLSFQLYRREVQDGEKREDFPNYYQNKLPRENGSEYVHYWYAFEPCDGFEPYNYKHTENPYVALNFLDYLLKKSSSENLSEDKFFREEGYKFNKKRVFYVLAFHPQGMEVIWLEPYYMKSQDKFGFLMDFKFYQTKKEASHTVVQQLSLSLTKNNEANKNFYADRYNKIINFINEFHKHLFPLKYGDTSISVDDKLLKPQSEFLKLKNYIFAGNKIHNSQYQGLKKYGPYITLSDNPPPMTCFICPPDKKELANELYRGLKGKTFATFPGMKRFFGYDLKSNITGVELADYSVSGIQNALDKAIEQCDRRRFVAVFIGDFESDENETYDQEYYDAKYIALQKNIATQFVRAQTLKNNIQLKWSIANIGLQLFAKLGGMPWIVEPSNDRCLIVGLGQAHDKDKNGSFQRYFSYSILTESSGLYKDIKILGDSQDFTTYRDHFRSQLYALFQNNIGQYNKFVVHTPFKMGKEDLQQLREILDELSGERTDKEFVALKFNQDNKYFAYSQKNNSKVPYESTLLRLSDKEFLIWFEGLQFNNPTVAKRYERPTHLEFIYPAHKDSLRDIDKRSYLQDAINLTGANWRGFNAKSTPVSIYYAQLVAKFYKRFSHVYQHQDVDEALEDSSLAPWFL